MLLLRLDGKEGRREAGPLGFTGICMRNLLLQTVDKDAALLISTSPEAPVWSGLL